MYTPELILALKCQILIGCLSLAVTHYLLRIPLSTGLWAVLLFNSLPLLIPPGLHTPLFLHDMIIPALALLVMARANLNHRLFWIALGATFAWPLIGIGISVAVGVPDNQWMTFLYRRLGFLIFILIGLNHALPRIKAVPFLNCCVVVWGFMLVPGLLQYFGYIDTDFLTLDSEKFRGLSIFDSSAAQRGFLGLNRGAVGVWASAIGTYCLAQVLLNRAQEKFYWQWHATVAVLSYVAILFSGTRTGLLAAVAGGGFVITRVLFSQKRLPVGRIVMLMMVGGLAAIYFLGPVMHRIAERFDIRTAAEGTGSTRLGVQLLTLQYSTGNLRAATVGMGVSDGLFLEEVGQYTEGLLNHPHSEFVMMLWQGGFVGLALYLLLLTTLYRQMKSTPGSALFHLATSGQAMLVTGLVSGLAVGNIMITSNRLATFGFVMAFVYGRIIHDLRAQTESTATDPAPAPQDQLFPWPRLAKTRLGS